MYKTKTVLLLLSLVLLSGNGWGHVVVDELEKMSKAETALVYLELGFQHILPLGLDHILFVLSLFLLSPRLKPIILHSTAFTAAHSITLALAMYNVVSPPARIIEPLISITIVFVALENILRPKLKRARIGIVFLFGLVHGLGFAASLKQLGLPEKSYLLSLVTFNVGVELGQLTVILLAFFLVGKWFGNRPFYRKAIVVPASAAIIFIATMWTIQRIFMN